MPDQYVITTAGASIVVRTTNTALAAQHARSAKLRGYPVFVRCGRSQTVELTHDGGTPPTWGFRGDSPTVGWADHIVRVLNEQEKLPA